MLGDKWPAPASWWEVGQHTDVSFHDDQPITRFKYDLMYGGALFARHAAILIGRPLTPKEIKRIRSQPKYRNLSLQMKIKVRKQLRRNRVAD